MENNIKRKTNKQTMQERKGSSLETFTQELPAATCSTKTLGAANSQIILNLPVLQVPES